jgi:hypothetical protein
MLHAAAMQLAVDTGTRVLATAGSDEKMEQCQRMRCGTVLPGPTL